jgi:hypothetical protein
MFAGFSNALKGTGGDFEINRVVGFISGVGYTLGALGFTAWNMAQGREFDVVAFCTAFAGGAAVLTGGTAAAVAVKDRNVASAKVIEQTGAVPAKPPAGPRVPTGEPPPVDAPDDRDGGES